MQEIDSTNIIKPEPILNVIPSTNASVLSILQQIERNMVLVEGGTFTMGVKSFSADVYALFYKKPAHQVTLSSFRLCRHVVTQVEWAAVMSANPSAILGENHPVEQVSWDDCQEFIRKLNAMTGKAYRLPTEAEWEYAARGGNRSLGYKYSGSNTLDDVAWYYANSGNSRLNDHHDLFQNHCRTHDVMTKVPNELGFYDMSGNVREWCSDYYGACSFSAQTDPKGPSSGSERVVRGGAWFSNARCCRVSYRSGAAPYQGDFGLGLRLAL